MSLAGYISLKVVDHGAHIGGFIAGAVSMFILIHSKSLKDLMIVTDFRIKIVLIVLTLIFIVGFFKEVFIYQSLVFN